MATSNKNTTTEITNTLQTIQVDNAGFFDAMNETIDKNFKEQILADTRREIQAVLADYKKREMIKGVMKWTEAEQRNFLEIVQEEIINTGIYTRQAIERVIEREVRREIENASRETMSLYDDHGNTIIANLKDDGPDFLKKSFIVDENTSITDYVLRLRVTETETTENAIRLLAVYKGYNALILVDEYDKLVGIIKAGDLQKHSEDGHEVLQGIPYASGLYGYYKNSSEELHAIMEKYNINVLPVVDSTNERLIIGIVTPNALAKNKALVFVTHSLANLQLENLKYATEKEA